MRAVHVAMLSIPVALSSIESQTIYTNRAAFHSALAAWSTVGFDNLIPQGVNYTALASSTVIGGATFAVSSGNPDLFVIDQSVNPAVYDWGSGPIFSPQSGAARAGFSASFASSNAFGIDFGTLYDPTHGQRGNFTVTLGNGVIRSFIYTGVYSGPPSIFDFFGIISATPFSSLILESDAGASQPLATYPVYDNFTFGMARSRSVVPEPSTLFLLAAGLCALGIGRARSSLRGHVEPTVNSDGGSTIPESTIEDCRAKRVDRRRIYA